MSKVRATFKCLLTIFLLVQLTNLFALVDLEDSLSDCIVGSKQIVLPAYPHAFNPSLIRWHGRLLMSFRVIPNAKKPFESWLGLVELNDSFEPISMPQQLTLRDPHSSAPSRMEDGRLIAVNGRLYLVYSDNEDLLISKGGFRVYVAELTEKNGRFIVKHIERLSDFEGNDEKRREKNWVPFDFNKQLMLAYSLTPHLIFTPIFDTESCATISCSHASISWDWGELRGGTCAALDGDHYIGFFHTCKRMASIHTPKEVNHYFMGAYLFENKKPFTITHVSKEPIIGKNFYHGAEYTPYWGTVRVVFPCGFIMEGDSFWVAYGRQDHELWVTQIDKKKLYESLIPAK